jgi:hypothetical protein
MIIDFAVFTSQTKKYEVLLNGKYSDNGMKVIFPNYQAHLSLCHCAVNFPAKHNVLILLIFREKKKHFEEVSWKSDSKSTMVSSSLLYILYLMSQLFTSMNMAL